MTEPSPYQPDDGDLETLVDEFSKRNFWFKVEAPEQAFPSIEFALPRGAGEKRTSLFARGITHGVRNRIWDWSFSEEFDALQNPSDGIIEVALVVPQFGPRSYSKIWTIPGVETGPAFGKLADGSQSGVSYDGSSNHLLMKGMEVDWLLRISHGEFEFDLGPQSPTFYTSRKASGNSGISLRYKGPPFATEVGDSIITGVMSDLLTELDLKYSVGVVAAPAQEFLASSIGWRKGPAVPAFPRNEYSSDAKALYWYGNRAAEFPLLQYLAYYQVLELFFESFSRGDAVRRMRGLLKDPAFDPNRAANLLALIDSTADIHRARLRDRDHLQTTLEMIVELSALKREVEASVHYFSKQKQLLPSLQKINLSQEDLHAQVSARISAIRNSIVHTKASLTNVNVQILLPSSAAARSLGPDIELVKWLAQRALIFGSKRRPGKEVSQ
ncbi:hypothetical protein [Herbiconiux sp. VKM Ac-2851]|uniref:hypothetical protein n=1 Tax=Herbiconiux sp. VKM Ac-2851 TaxID=2739025 RepID=UPI0015677C3E|nr:hypothetical protein [Herbiconiux sp. VKM Ac-2851]NQX36629.1 hypothetical protein [Herbiconiux sp. VKM Ac-2851]